MKGPEKQPDTNHDLVCFTFNLGEEGQDSRVVLQDGGCVVSFCVVFQDNG